MVLLSATCWSLAGVMLMSAYASHQWQALAGLLMIFQAFCGAVTFLRFRATRDAVLPDFLSVFLFMQLVNKTITFLGIVTSQGNAGLAIIANRMEDAMSVPLVYQFQAELVFFAATVLFTVTWCLLERGRIRALWHEPSARLSWILFGGSALGYLVLQYNIIPIGGLGQVEAILRLMVIGALAILLGGRTRFALGKSHSWVVYLAMAPLMVWALRSGMKGNVLLVMMPVLLPIFRRLTFVRVGFLSMFIVFVLLFVFPFSEQWREANWASYGNSENVGIAEVASRVGAQWDQRGLIETATVSAGRWFARGSSAAQGGLVMQISASDGHIGGILISGLKTIFIPRVLWPGKPVYAPGAWFTWYLGEAPSPEEASTSTQMMMPTELYWMYGVPGVVIGIPLIALLYFFVWDTWLRQAATRLVPLAALFPLIGRAGYLEGIHTLYAVTAPIIMLVYVWAMDVAQRQLLPQFNLIRNRR